MHMEKWKDVGLALRKVGLFPIKMYTSNFEQCKLFASMFLIVYTKYQ